METESKSSRRYIEQFNPDVEVLNNEHQDFLHKFNAGSGYENFNSFISEEALESATDGDGVTYLIWNVFYDSNHNELKRELVSYYTLSATAIPYIDRIRRDPDEAERYGSEFDEQICGIPALEIKMFAVDTKYQDLFFCYENEVLPISAWILRGIIDYAEYLLTNTLGLKAIFLHALPNAEKFYYDNGFRYIKINMQPLHCVDSEYSSMYLSLRNVIMNYDS